MRRGTIFIALFILIAAGIIAASRFISAQPPLDITVAVEASAQPWLQNAVTAFNNTEPVVNGTRRIRITLTPMDDLRVWLGSGAWSAVEHPAAWIPASSASVQYAAEAGLPFELAADSLAWSPLVWGGFVSRINALTQDNAQPFDWPAVAAAAKAESWSLLGGDPAWQFVKLAFAQPTSKMAGLAVMFSGAAAFHESGALTGEALRERPFRDWMLPVLGSVPNFGTLGGDPAAAMARQGAALADAALLPEVDWLVNLPRLERIEPLVFAYPTYQFALDFPLARWDDGQTTADDRAAVDALAAWLLAPEQQALALEYGLRPADGAATPDNALFLAGAAYGIRYDAMMAGAPVTPPPRADAQGYVNWIEAN